MDYLFFIDKYLKRLPFVQRCICWCFFIFALRDFIHFKPSFALSASGITKELNHAPVSLFLCTIRKRVLSRMVMRAIRSPISQIELKQGMGLVSHPSQLVLQRAIDHPQCGVFVLWGVHGSGKSSYVRQAAADLLQKNRHTILLNAASYKYQRHPHPLLWLNDALNLDPDLDYSPFLPPAVPGIYSPPPTCIFIDQFDHMFNHPDAQSFIVGLAEESRLTKRFSVIVSVTNPENAQTILKWNGGEKIKLVGDPGIGCWNNEHVRALVQQLPLRDDQRGTLIELGSIAKTPGFVLETAFAGVPINDVFHRDKAQELHARWQIGISMLKRLPSVSVNFDPKNIL